MLKRLIKKSNTIYLKDLIDPLNCKNLKGEDISEYIIDEEVRDFAIVIVDGEIYEGQTHTEAIENNTNLDYEEIYIEDAFSSHDEQLLHKVSKLIKKSEKINLKDIISQEDINVYGLNTDYGNRSLAIAIIDNIVYSGDAHKDIVEMFINDNQLNVELDYSEGFVTHDEQYDVDYPMAFASYIKGIDGKDYIAIYPDSLYLMDLQECKTILQSEYGNAIICVDKNDRYEYYDKNKDIYIETI